MFSAWMEAECYQCAVGRAALLQFESEKPSLLRIFPILSNMRIKVQCCDISKCHPVFLTTLAQQPRCRASGDKTLHRIKSEVIFSGRGGKKTMDKIINYAIDLFDTSVIEQVYDF